MEKDQKIQASNFMYQYAGSEELDGTLEFINAVKSTFRDQPGKFDEFSRAIQEITAQRFELDGQNQVVGLKPEIPEEGLKVVKAVLQGHGQLMGVFNTFLPENLRFDVDVGMQGITALPEKKKKKKKKKKKIGYEDAAQFLRNVKGRDGGMYQVFLATFSLIKMSGGKVEDLRDQLVKVLADYPDLLQELGKFIPVVDAKRRENRPDRIKNCRIEDQEVVEGPKAEKTYEKGLKFFQKVQGRLSKESYQLFLKCFFCYKEEKFGKSELEKEVGSILGQDPILMEDFRNFMRMCESLSGDDEGKEKELRIEPGRGKKRNRDEVEGLDKPKEEDEANKRRRKYHQDMMFQVQDDRFEMEMLLTWLKSAVKYAEETIKGTEESKIEGGKKIHFKRMIEKLYGSHSPQVLNAFVKKPAEALQRVLDRLRKKLKEYEDAQADLNVIWKTAQTELHRKLYNQ